MTKEEAIEFLETPIQCSDKGDERDLREAMDMGIKALEQTKWIPCNERLSEPDVEVLVTDDAGGLATIGTDSIYESEVTGEKAWYTSQNVTA